MLKLRDIRKISNRKPSFNAPKYFFCSISHLRARNSIVNSFPGTLPDGNQRHCQAIDRRWFHPRQCRYRSHHNGRTRVRIAGKAVRDFQHHRTFLSGQTEVRIFNRILLKKTLTVFFRLHLFGRDSTIRPGWLTVGPMLTNSNYNAETYAGYFSSLNLITTGCTERIEALRPKSPPPKGNKGAGGGRGGFTRGAARGGRGRWNETTAKN